MMAMGAEYHVAYWVYFGRCLINKNYLLIRKRLSGPGVQTLFGSCWITWVQEPVG